MPLYEYLCHQCEAPFDVARPISAIYDPAVCPKCEATNGKAQRQLTRTHFYGAAVEDASYDPGLGMVVKSSKHRKDEAKARGLIEIGNEKPEVVHKYFDDKRTEIREQRWAEAEREKVYED